MAISPREMLAPNGPLAAALGVEFEPRPEQQRMADAVERAMEQRTHLLVEAGTGVGKSFAYLAPAAARCIERREVVVVATNTISLQEQLVEKDIPVLERVCNADVPEGATPPLRPVLVKGRGNYLSIRRLKLASARQAQIFPDAASRRSLHEVEEWAYETRDGTLATLPVLERPAVWDRVQSDSGNCMGRRCPHYRECFYQTARRAMEGANLLVCNHALFFSDLALRARGVGFLPKYDHVILDEAHSVEDVAAEHFGLSLSEGRVSHLLSLLYHERTGRGYLATLQLLSGGAEAVEGAVRLVMAATRAARGFFGDLLALADRGATRNGRVPAPGMIENELTAVMNDLAVRLRRLREDATQEADRFELNAYAERAAEVADHAEALVGQTMPGCVYWVETGTGRGGRARRVALACSPIEVAPLLRERLFAQEHSTILTSATLATRTIMDDEPGERAETAFAHAIDRLGADGAATLQLGSPFDFARQMEVFIDRSMPAPAQAADDRAYLDALAERVALHARQTGGGAFVLCTSFRAIDGLAARLGPELEDEGLPLLAQGREVGRGELLRRFRESGRAVLLGAASFWQGVDVRGEALRNVIITRLPFEPPDRPLVEARLDRIRERGGDPFREESLPRAVIRFKQGIGRLIRSAHDRGRVVILDPRVLTTGYGRAFLAALPAGVAPEVRP